MINKKLVLGLNLVLCLITSNCFAHSGRLDSNGGHRVNIRYSYIGKYLVLKSGVRLAREREIKFVPGDYHYHVHPNYIPHIKDGIFLAVPEIDLKYTVTDKTQINRKTRSASKNSDKFHTLDCRYSRRIKDENAILFKSRNDAIANDYIACKVCKAGEVQ